MEIDSFRALLRPEGRRLLAEAEQMDLSEAARLRTLSALRRQGPPALVTAAYETALLRARAAGKFSRAGEMYFTREALEQASGEEPARHRARRFAGFDLVADLGCGIGGDTLALAEVARVAGVERDPLRLLIARENALALGVSARTDWVQADIAGGGPLRVAAAFVDPARRRGTKRLLRPESYEPPLATVLAWAGRFDALAVKVAPGIADQALAGFHGEVEFVAVGEELKEAVLWLGGFAEQEGRRATVLPSGATLSGEPRRADRCAPAGRFLIEPNAAVIRAHLLGQLAHDLDAWQIDETIAYLSADRRRQTPLARFWEVERVLPFSVARVREYLRGQGVGRLTVKKRGSPIEPEAFIRMMRPRGDAARTVVLTRQLGAPVAIVCLDADAARARERVGASPATGGEGDA